jgi:hypothetical protein
MLSARPALAVSIPCGAGLALAALMGPLFSCSSSGPRAAIVAVAASAAAPPAGAVNSVATVLTHNIHQDPRALNAQAAAAALAELHQDDLVIASHAYIPNKAAGTWDFTALDALVDFLLVPPLPGTLIYNPAHCPSYLAMGGIPGARPADNAAYAQYLKNLVAYFNTTGGFTDGATNYRRMPVSVRRFEVWGEPDLNEFPDDNRLPDSFSAMTPAQAQNFFNTPALYRAMYEAVVPAMKAADPSIAVGGPAISSIEDAAARAYVTELLSTTAALDFISYHDYAQWTAASTDRQAFAETASLVAAAQQVRQQIAASPHPQAELWITEGNGNPVASLPPLDNRASNDFDVPYLASLVRGYVLAGVSGYARFELIEPAGPGNVYGALEASGARRPAFFGWKLLVDAVVRGAPLRASSASDANVETLALQRDASTLHVLVINKSVTSPADNSSAASARGAPVEIRLSIDRPVSSAAVRLVDPSAPGIQVRALSGGGELVFTLAGYGVAWVIASF